MAPRPCRSAGNRPSRDAPASGRKGRMRRLAEPARSLCVSAAQTSSRLQSDSRGDRGTQFHRTCPAASQHPLDAAGAGTPAPASRGPGIWSPSGRCSPSPLIPGLESPLPGGPSSRGSSPQPAPGAVFLPVGQQVARDPRRGAATWASAAQGRPGAPAGDRFGTGGAASFHIRSLRSRDAGDWTLGPDTLGACLGSVGPALALPPASPETSGMILLCGRTPVPFRAVYELGPCAPPGWIAGPTVFGLPLTSPARSARRTGPQGSWGGGHGGGPS
ncbi:FERM domain-containing protein 1 isoform X2 [Mustela putorius furo]|uniref:FERM domain-containing protein 1 isoform X2 n=1 Tax=Mustela putorius furo TaxID=9669 RepID=A0A8U0V2V3_MUSPF|nr:FERM domain-containing protein 1 isoform X2 [Mustela putorius furo]